MCGILGAISLRGGLSLDAMERGSDAIRHRGPEGSGLWWESDGNGSPRVVLAHRRLRILDLSPAAAQPILRARDGRMRPAHPRERNAAALALIFNGEIYNYLELRRELIALGHEFRSTGDTEVLLAAFAEWGDRCVERLDGMFAFAIWDAERQELFCARDRFGEKPLYMVRRGDGAFAFASEVKALVAAGLVRPEWDDRALYRFLAFGEQSGVAQTVWRGVERLRPAHCLTVTVRGDRLAFSERRYWTLPDGIDESMGDRDAAERFHSLFTDSVRLRLRSDVTVGTSLSGGLDSSSVLCTIHELGASGGQHAFSARMDDPALDEGRFIAAVLSATGVEGFGVTPTAERFLADCDTLFLHQEEPFTSSSIFASFLVHRLASEHDTVVMLDGQGADEYLAGYAHYPAAVVRHLAERGRFVEWARERRALRKRVGVDPVPPRAALVSWLRRGRARGVSTIDAPRDVSCLAPELRARFADEQPRPMRYEGEPLRARLRADLLDGHLQELLRYADRNSMAFSREVRLPFLSHHLVEFCARLPTRLLYRRGVSKRVLRDAMRGRVPDVVLDRTDKVGFVTPWTRWWAGDLGPALRERLRAARASLAGTLPFDDATVPPEMALAFLSIASVDAQLKALVPRRETLSSAAVG